MISNDKRIQMLMSKLAVYKPKYHSFSIESLVGEKQGIFSGDVIEESKDDDQFEVVSNINNNNSVINNNKINSQDDRLRPINLMFKCHSGKELEAQQQQHHQQQQQLQQQQIQQQVYRTQSPDCYACNKYNSDDHIIADHHLPVVSDNRLYHLNPTQQPKEAGRPILPHFSDIITAVHHSRPFRSHGHHHGQHLPPAMAAQTPSPEFANGSPQLMYKQSPPAPASVISGYYPYQGKLFPSVAVPIDEQQFVGARFCDANRSPDGCSSGSSQSSQSPSEKPPSATYFMSMPSALVANQPPVIGHTRFNPISQAKNKRVRTAFTPSQLLRLEAKFERSQYLVGTERRQLARELGLNETQIKVWFQNRRTKHKREKHQDSGVVNHPNVSPGLNGSRLFAGYVV